jgi:hypothetical protein
MLGAIVFAVISAMLNASPDQPPGVSKSRGSSALPPGEAKPGGSFPDLGPLSVTDVIAAFRVERSSLIYVDEPPGKLCEILAVATLPGTKAKVAMKIELQERPFSETRNWDLSATKLRKVIVSTSKDELDSFTPDRR